VNIFVFTGPDVALLRGIFNLLAILSSQEEIKIMPMPMDV
jgi:hypothetical protein